MFGRPVGGWLLVRLPLMRVLKKKGKREKEPGRFVKASYPIFYPLSFLFDLLFVMHDKLMIFDLYRKFSAKMLRIRLDTQDVATEEVAKDFHYRDWLLRSVEEGLLSSMWW